MNIHKLLLSWFKVSKPDVTIQDRLNEQEEMIEVLLEKVANLELALLELVKVPKTTYTLSYNEDGTKAKKIIKRKKKAKSKK